MVVGSNPTRAANSDFEFDSLDELLKHEHFIRISHEDCGHVRFSQCKEEYATNPTLFIMQETWPMKEKNVCSFYVIGLVISKDNSLPDLVLPEFSVEECRARKYNAMIKEDIVLVDKLPEIKMISY